MTTIRCILGIVGGAATGYAIALCLLGLATDLHIGVSVAVVSACVLGIGLIRAVQADQAAERAHRRAYREVVWQRRAREARRQTTYQEKRAS